MKKKYYNSNSKFVFFYLAKPLKQFWQNNKIWYLELYHIHNIQNINIYACIFCAYINLGIIIPKIFYNFYSSIYIQVKSNGLNYHKSLIFIIYIIWWSRSQISLYFYGVFNFIDKYHYFKNLTYQTIFRYKKNQVSKARFLNKVYHILEIQPVYIRESW